MACYEIFPSTPPRILLHSASDFASGSHDFFFPIAQRLDFGARCRAALRAAWAVNGPPGTRQESTNQIGLARVIGSSKLGTVLPSLALLPPSARGLLNLARVAPPPVASPKKGRRAPPERRKRPET